MSLLSTESRIKRTKFSRKYEALMLTVVTIIVIMLALFLAGLSVWKYVSLSKQSDQLRDLSNQDLEQFKNIEETKNLVASWNTLDDMISSLDTIREEKVGYENYQTLLNNPYKYFLQYIYLPRLNIWENPYTQEIDTNLIGTRFLQENPYTDLALINTWTRIFEDIGEAARDLGITSSNQVKDIEIKKINELDNGYFSIPLTLSFESTDRRAFLLLMEKLALTSHHSNISLINEFFFYLWETIKKEYSYELEQLTIDNSSLANEKNIDKKLGYLFDQRVNHGGQDVITPLAKQKGENAKSFDQIIDMAIRGAAGCSQQNSDECYYLFREKFRTVPYLIYPITNTRKSKTTVLKEFLQSTLPPIIKINEFTFNETKQQGANSNSPKFEGKIDIEVFGRGISQNELEHISQALGKQCFAQEMVINPQTALDVIEENIIQMSKINTLDTERANQLFELKALIQAVELQYTDQSQYNKIIKLFEIFRMLKDAGLCTSSA